MGPGRTQWNWIGSARSGRVDARVREKWKDWKRLEKQWTQNIKILEETHPFFDSSHEDNSAAVDGTVRSLHRFIRVGLHTVFTRSGFVRLFFDHHVAPGDTFRQRLIYFLEGTKKLMSCVPYCVKTETKDYDTLFRNLGFQILL